MGWVGGVTLLDKVQNKHIRKSLKVTAGTEPQRWC
jgi:hypothetical protein